MTEDRIPLSGSAPSHPPGARPARRAEPDHPVEVTVVLRQGLASADHALARKAHRARTGHPVGRPVLTLEEVETLHAPDPRDVDQVGGFARAHGLEVVEVSRIRHEVVLRGPAAAMERAFGVEQHHFEHPGGAAYRGHRGAIHLPRNLESRVVGILGLDDIPLARPSVAGLPADPGNGGLHSRSIAAIGALYGVPADADAGGHRITLLEFGGGFHPSDMGAFFGDHGPRIRVVESGGPGPGGVNDPLPRERLAVIRDAWLGGASFTDLLERFGAEMGSFMNTVEVTMDLQIAGTLGGGADLEVRFLTPAAASWRRGIFDALQGTGEGDGSGPPTAISISWGGSEEAWGSMKLDLVHGALQAAAHMGVTVCCSSGDFGSCNASRPPSRAAVNFPASSPAVLAVGGTTITADGPEADVVWNRETLGTRMATGGGMSGQFPRPEHQAGRVPVLPGGTWMAEGRDGEEGRWVPDVAANADFATGYQMILAGGPFVGGGTSAATPLWAALVTVLAARTGHPLGLLSPVLYGALPEQGLRDVTEGDNDVAEGAVTAYRAGPGWDACTGLGVPDGKGLARLLADP